MKDPTNPFQDRGEIQRYLAKFCPACQAIPQAGYCNLSGCPSAPSPRKGASPRIIMSCNCGNAMLYPRRTSFVPDWVVFIESDGCPACDADECRERWLDADRFERDPMAVRA